MTILQVAHVTEIPGPVQTLAGFFKNRKKQLYKIYHPTFGCQLKSSQFLEAGNIFQEKKSWQSMVPRYVVEFFWTVQWIGQIKEPIDKAIGMNCFDTLPLLVFRFFRKDKIKEVIFFNTDFSRQRFDNKLLNWIYVSLDKFCAKQADKICCNTHRTIEARIKEGVAVEKIVHVPNGVFLKDLGAVDWENKKFNKKLLYVGYISQEHGLQEVAELLKKNNLELEIIGGGDYEENLKKHIKNLGIEDSVHFLGRKSHEEVLQYLKDFSGFGIAPYSLSSDWTYYCDPVKVKEYLAAGVPVLVSDVPEIAGMIEKKNLGFVYKDKESLEKILGKMAALGNDEYALMIKNIQELRPEFDLDLIYEKI